MNDTSPSLLALLKGRLSLNSDKADDAVIDQALRAGIELRGANVWLLMFAILIASIGLNVNSTAVVIGAMLISPLMGPIMGIGYGIGVLDFPLMRRALKNLGIAIVISLLTSSVYFLLSPLHSVQSELLARTSPTIWDVLIALAGGLAGIVGATRQEKSNVIPGVAIATALMPPLCTASYGLANGNWQYFLGAFYLFTINCVCIAFSAAMVTRAFHVEKRRFIDERVAARVRIYFALIVVLTVLPSVYLAAILVQQEVFANRAQRFIDDQLRFPHAHVAETNIDRKGRVIEATLIGDYVPEAGLTALAASMPAAGLAGAKLEIHQAGQRNIDVSALKSGLLSDLYSQSRVLIDNKDKEIQALRAQIRTGEEERALALSIPSELHALFPQVSKIWLARVPEWDSSGASAVTTVVVNVAIRSHLTNQDRGKVEHWLRARFKSEHVKLVVEPLYAIRRKNSR